MGNDWAFDGVFGVYGPYLFILLAGWLATDLWRYLGVMFAGDFREGSEVMTWVRAVATTLIAGVIAKLILFPTGALESTPVALRLISVAAGMVTFLALKRNVMLGIASAIVVLLVGWWLMDVWSESG